MQILNYLKKEWLILAILLAPVLYLLSVWNQLPESLPVRWNVSGEASGYGPPYLLPLINMGLYLLLIIIPKIDPRKENYSLFTSTFYKLRLIIVLFISTISSLTITKGLGFHFNLVWLVLVVTILLLTTIGNYMTTLRPNWFVGIRLPWTLESDRVWRKTHFLGGKLWFWFGIALLCASFFLPIALMTKLMLGSVLIMVIVPIAYSYFLYHQEKRNAE